MKKGIHPNYGPATVTCACGKVWEIKSTRKEYKVGICADCQKKISPGAQEVHGIKDEDLAGEKRFSEIVDEVQDWLDGCDLAGFNSNRFDIPLLVEEFLRVGIDLDLSKRKFVDVQNIYHKLEKRTLVAAYKFYCNKNLEDAHSALADTKATLEVLEAQLDHYPNELKNDIDFLAEFSKMTDNVDFAGRIVYDENHNEVFNFGKYKGQKVSDVFRTDPGYYSWMMKGDFALNTKQIITKIKLRDGIKF